MNTTLAPAPAAVPPRVGIVAVALPEDGPWIRFAWVEQDALMVGYDPARADRRIVEVVLDTQIGKWIDIDHEEAAR